MSDKLNKFLPSPSRRRFVQGLAVGSALLSVPFKTTAGYSRIGAETLRGQHFNLAYQTAKVNFTGAERYATAINGSLPAPTLYWREGDTVTLKVSNHLAEDTSIHWHGLILPSSQDGVPHISDGFHGIQPGQHFTYQFPVKQNGTYWYHSHSNFQEQTGAYGAIIIEPREGYPYHFDREYVVLLSDWSDTDPDTIYAQLKKHPHYYNTNPRTVGNLWDEIAAKGIGQTLKDRAMWGQMRMSDRDIADVTGYTYTYLMNGITPAAGWLGLFRPKEKVLLRFINAAAMSFFDIRIPQLKMKIVAADGQYVEPVSVDEFRIGAAETYDVIVEPSADIAYTIFAQAMDRSGYARGTLSPDPALRAEVPAFDPMPILSHSDMGMAHDDGEHAGHHSKHHHAGHTAAKHSSNKTQTDKVVLGPQVAMLADNPQYRLTDPGVGLRDNGRRVLSYADLMNLYPTADPRDPEREITLHLTGNMNRYMWSINGIKFADAEPLYFRYGERLRINLINDTMMSHPIHLHGMWSDLETGDSERIPRKHTVIVQPGSKISYLVTADAKGNWAYHCHLLYHMLGMFRQVIVA